jgi:hypothetical protein
MNISVFWNVTLSSDSSLPTFLKNLLPPSSGQKSKLNMEIWYGYREGSGAQVLMKPVGVKRTV